MLTARQLIIALLAVIAAFVGYLLWLTLTTGDVIEFTH